MTVTSMVPNDAPYLPHKVTTVARETLRNFPHSKKVGNYLLGTTLGEGSFAKVKEALHIPTGELVAVKIIDKKKSREDSYVRKNLRREGKILQMIRHRHIVQLLEIMETQNSYYLVTELCRGGDLMDYISARRKLLEPEVKKYIRQIVSAIDYLHRLGILHRDLKIENLLLDEYQDMKIIDFGLSNCIKVAQTKDGPQCPEFCVTQCGSPAYAAPELLGRKKYGPQVDVWSIGVNMYAMLTGNLPYTVEPFNIKSLHNKMVTGQMNPLPDGVSHECRDIMKKFLTADPDRRITLEDAMKHPWVADGPGNPMVAAPCPNKVKTETLDNSILKHMSEKQGFRIGEIVKFVTGNIPSSSNATYHLLLRKLNKHYGNLRASGKIAADPKLLRKSQQPILPQMRAKVTSHAQHVKMVTMPRPGINHTANTVRSHVAEQPQKARTTDTDATADHKVNDKDNSEGSDETFTDLLSVKGRRDGLHIPRAKSPFKTKTEATHTTYNSPANIITAPKQYIINSAVKRTIINHSTKPPEANTTTADDSRETVTDRPIVDHSGRVDGHFRKRSNSVPGHTDRPRILVNKLILEPAEDSPAKNAHNKYTNSNMNGHQYVPLILQTKRHNTPYTDVNSPRTSSQQTNHLHTCLYESNGRRLSQCTPGQILPVKPSHIPKCEHIHMNKDTNIPTIEAPTIDKHALLRPTTKINKISQAKADNEDTVIDEHISVLSGSLPRTATSLSTNSNHQAPSPLGLPNLSPPTTAALKRSS